MRIRSLVAGVLAVLLGAFPTAAADDDPLPQVATADEADTLDRRTKRLAVSLPWGDAEMAALTAHVVQRFPDLEELALRQSRSSFAPGTLELLPRLRRLRALTLTGEPSLSDSQCETIGSLHRLESLRMSLY